MVLKIGKHCPRDLIYTEYNTGHTKSIQNVIQSTHNTIQTSYNTGHTKSTLNIIQGHSKCIQNIIQNTQDWFRDKWGRRWGKALSSRWPSWSAICPRARSSIHTSPVACSYLDRFWNSQKVILIIDPVDIWWEELSLLQASGYSNFSFICKSTFIGADTPVIVVIIVINYDHVDIKVFNANLDFLHDFICSHSSKSIGHFRGGMGKVVKVYKYTLTRKPECLKSLSYILAVTNHFYAIMQWWWVGLHRILTLEEQSVGHCSSSQHLSTSSITTLMEFWQNS